MRRAVQPNGRPTNLPQAGSHFPVSVKLRQEPFARRANLGGSP